MFTDSQATYLRAALGGRVKHLPFALPWLGRWLCGTSCMLEDVGQGVVVLFAQRRPPALCGGGDGGPSYAEVPGVTKPG